MTAIVYIYDGQRELSLPTGSTSGDFIPAVGTLVRLGQASYPILEVEHVVFDLYLEECQVHLKEVER